jgi:dihydroorotate dehydrogenase (NAD+) catalytic subunit
VRTGDDVVEYLLAGASAVAIGTAHFAEPRVGSRVIKELERYMIKHDVRSVRGLVGAVEPW